MNIGNAILWFVLAVFGGLIYYSHDDRVLVCDESQKVSKILELRYREAVILLENGNEIIVNQASLKPGDNFCVKWSIK